MDKTQQAVIAKTLAVTAACIAISVVVTAAVTLLATGTLELGLGLLIAILAPAVIAPVGSYHHLSLAARLREANRRLEALSQTDPLTGTFNRRRFLELAGQQLSLARRHGYPTSLLLIDFDHFKQVNDRFGHTTGDQVLVEATRLMAGALRASDTLARFGGEEFIVLLPHTARAGALRVAERVRTSIGEHRFLHQGQRIPMAVSIGGVSCDHSDQTLELLTSQADRLLYVSKQTGRNRSTVEAVAREGAPQLAGVD